MRLKWGDQPKFALAIGGFHPRYTPPPNFPVLNRVAINLSNSKNPRIILDGYLALTANSLQIGAGIDFHFEKDIGISDITVDATLSFDALVSFNPFHFIVTVKGGIRVETDYGGIGADLTLDIEGPNPWSVDAKVRVRILRSKRTAKFSKKFGKEQSSPQLDTLNPQEFFVGVVKKAQYWRAEPAIELSTLLVLAEIQTPPENTIVAHPLAALVFRQPEVPLKMSISQIGSRLLTFPATFELGIEIGNATIDRASESAVFDFFAIGQYTKLSAEQQLTDPGFESKQAGLSIALDYFAGDEEFVVEQVLEYEVITLEGNASTSVQSSYSLPIVHRSTRLAQIGGRYVQRYVPQQSSIPPYL
jgi:hypothetical protein